MQRILTKTILATTSIILAILIVFHQNKSTDVTGVSNISNTSHVSLSPRKENKDLEINHQLFDGDTENPDNVISFKTTYDINDVNSMIIAANSIDDDEKRGQKLKSIARLWTLIDPDACLKWALSIANDKIGYEYITAHVILTLVGNSQFEKAIQLVQEIPQGRLRDTAIGYSMLDLANLDLRTVERLLNLISSNEQMERSARTLSKALIEADKLPELKEVYEDLPYGTMKEALGSAVVRGLMFQDPLKALDWLRANPELSNVENFESLAAGFAKLDPLRGVTIADEIDDPIHKKKYLSYLLNGWAAKNPREAGKWITDQISSVNSDQKKDEFFMIARNSLAHDQNLLFTQIKDIKDQGARDAATLSAVAALSEYNPSKAAELAVATLVGQPSKQAETIAITARNWLKRDPLEASKWIGNLAGGSVKDVAISELVTNILTNDRDIVMASSWASQISDPKIKAQVNANIDRTKP